MRILLIHHNAKNLGDVAIVHCVLNQLEDAFPEASFILELSHPTLSKKNFFISLIVISSKKSNIKLLNEINKYDLVVSVAGDSISERYAYFFRFYEIWLIKKAKGKYLFFVDADMMLEEKVVG